MNKIVRQLKLRPFSFIFSIHIRVNALNSGYVLNTGNGLLYTMMSHFAAFDRITHYKLMDRLAAHGPIIY